LDTSYWLRLFRAGYWNRNSNVVLLCALLAILVIWACAGSKAISTSDNTGTTSTIGKSEVLATIDKPEVMAWVI